MKPIHLLTVSGSLRNGSFNTAIAESAITLAPSGITVARFNGIGDLPLFNPDLDRGDVPPAVATWRAALAAADAILVSTPEYAFGVPGVMKNALDWVVSSGEFVHKPTAVISASSSSAGGDKAHAAISQILAVMTATLVEGASLLVPQAGVKIGADGQIKDAELAQALREVLAKLLGAVENHPAP
ncbi:NADPH-dependent FMN reductase [Andreprevotia chitinilytica]|uniref:NADPH-dependent FMN reductase n=1 Tax=Andreprevotia chitinilytica TaxID=396808 RepID=UPI000553E3B0|nr:NADPH-dependent FMN reductase [Andreprevotia chitinilytica]